MTADSDSYIARHLVQLGGAVPPSRNWSSPGSLLRLTKA
jgi:hypothetical protein